MALIESPKRRAAKLASQGYKINMHINYCATEASPSKPGAFSISRSRK
jgi:hypothetical protein